VMTGIGPVSIDLYLPAFPMIEADFGEPGAARTMASYLVGLAMGQLLYGPLSDRFGRKPPLYFGFIIYTIGALGCAFSTSMTMLMVCRVVQAMGACSGMAIGRAIVRDRCEPEQAARAFSTLMTIVSVAPIVAPIAGGFIVSALGWRATFYIQAALGMMILIGVHFALTESLDPKHVRSLQLTSVLRTYLNLFRDRAFVGYSLIGGFGMAALFCYVAGAPTVLPAMYHVPPETFGWLIGVNGLAFMTASRLNMHALRRLAPTEILARYIWLPPLVGTVLIGIGAFSNLVATVPLALLLTVQFCFFITTARILPNVSALALASRSRDAGTASALLGTIQSIASMITGMTIAIVGNGTLVPLGIIMTLSVLVCWLVHVWLRSRTH
jgi:MFS transporter, DHA1 family, multidrug resistance protein